MRDRNFINSLARGLKILEIAGQASDRLTLTEIANLCGYNKTATQRFLNTLIALGYLNRDENRRYFLTAKVLSLGFNFLNSSNIRMISKPFIDDLSAELNKTVNLAVLNGAEILYLYRKEVTRYLKYDLYDGSRLPAYCTAAGKIILAGLTDFELDKKLNEMILKPITPKTITDRKKLSKEIISTRKRGYSISDQELSMDLFSMAVPIIGDQNKTVAAVNVTMDARDKDKPESQNVIMRLMKKGQLISNMLGYSDRYPNL